MGSALSCAEHINQRVVVIGGGYAGVEVAKLLDGIFHVTLLEKREFHNHCIAGLRACVDKAWIEVIYIYMSIVYR